VIFITALRTDELGQLERGVTPPKPEPMFTTRLASVIDASNPITQLYACDLHYSARRLALAVDQSTIRPGIRLARQQECYTHNYTVV
jgi:hypothetical protein